jgi:asparagine N-glycosylation enzyme membrane subunit Stt3
VNTTGGESPAEDAPTRQAAAPWAGLLLLVLVACLSWLPRQEADARVQVPAQGSGEGRMVTTDPDSLYHLRRVDRALREGLAVDGRDDYLNYPEGARIPWPPYYTKALAGLLAPAAPEADAERRAFVEDWVIRLPLVFAVITSLLAALAGWVLARTPGALFAGSYHALSMGSISYSRLGNGDHHAWVSMLFAAMLLLLTLTFRPDGLATRRKGLVGGVAAGVLAGVLIGSWVGALLHVLVFELALGWLIFANARKHRPGLASYGLSFHLSALLVLAPAVLASPWKEEFPWMVVNLSWFHLAHLAAGALVFVPLLFLTPRSGSFRRYPWILSAALVVLGLVVVLVDAGPGRGIREGFEWVSRTNEFMSTVRESQPLIGPQAKDAYQVFLYLGYAVVLLPLVWLLAVWRAFRPGGAVLVPWVIALPPLALQAAGQMRFTEALSMPLAVILAWGVGLGLSWLADRCTKRPSKNLVVTLTALAALLLSGAAHWRQSVYPTVRQFAAGGAPGGPGQKHLRGIRLLFEWLRVNTPATRDYCVLANWSQGHAIEWAADRPSVSTNFGSYVGEESFRDPAVFLLTEDLAEAEAILERRAARYVLVPNRWPNAVGDMLRVALPERWSRYLSGDVGQPGHVRPAWFRTVGAQLMFGGMPHPRAGIQSPRSIDFLRMVHASPITTRQPPPVGAQSPCGWVYEHVAGATLEARAKPGVELRVEFEVGFPRANYKFPFVASARAGEDGVVRVRIPYATQGPNGEGRALGKPRWVLGAREGALVIGERDVLEGAVLRLP